MTKPIDATSIVIDRYALLQLLSVGQLTVDGGFPIRPSKRFVLFMSEYAAFYAAAAAAVKRHNACGKLHDVFGMVSASCDCQDGWVPVLSPSFLGAVTDPPVEILPLPAEAMGLRMRVSGALPALSKSEVSLLVGLVWTPNDLAICTARRSPSFLEALSQAEMSVYEVDHSCCRS